MEKREFNLAVEGARVRFRFGHTFLKDRKSWGTARHSNVNYELHVILRGSCVVEVAEDTLSLGEGDLLLIAPGVYHKAQANEGEFERFTMSLTIPKSAMAASLRRRIGPYANGKVPAEICGLCQAIIQEWDGWVPYQESLLRFQLGWLMVFLLRWISGMEQPDRGLTTGEEENSAVELADMITDIENFFASNMASYGAMEQLADQLHLSKRQLGRLIQELYGMTFREKLLAARMDCAAWLLRTTQNSTGEIARQVGYGSEPTFYTKFKHHHGISPGQYRR